MLDMKLLSQKLECLMGQLRMTGEHMITLNLHQEINVEIKVVVIGEE